jgi:hypothetical protein
MKTSFLAEFQKSKKLTNHQMAEMLGVCEKTWRNYKKSASEEVPKRFALAVDAASKKKIKKTLDVR